jgi:hypothetical protein
MPFFLLHKFKVKHTLTTSHKTKNAEKHLENGFFLKIVPFWHDGIVAIGEQQITAVFIPSHCNKKMVTLRNT